MQKEKMQDEGEDPGRLSYRVEKNYNLFISH